MSTTMPAVHSGDEIDQNVRADSTRLNTMIHGQDAQLGAVPGAHLPPYGSFEANDITDPWSTSGVLLDFDVWPEFPNILKESPLSPKP